VPQPALLYSSRITIAQNTILISSLIGLKEEISGRQRIQSSSFILTLMRSCHLRKVSLPLNVNRAYQLSITTNY